MTVSLREPLAGYCGLPSFYLIRTEISSRQLSASFSRGFRRMGRSSGPGPIGDQRGIDRFAGKSEIAEGRSDLRESVIRNDLLVGGHQRTDRSELLVALCALLGSATG